MEEMKLEELQFMLQKEIVMNFFGENHSIVFDNADDVREFLQFIHIYDNRYDEKFSKAEEVKEVAWTYCYSSHRHQLEWAGKKEYELLYAQYFYRRNGGFVGYEPIKYSMIKDYIKTMNVAKEKLKPLLENFKDILNCISKKDEENS